MTSDRVLILDDRRVLLSDQAAERAEVGLKTWSSWQTRRWPRNNPVPPADDWINARTPVWWPETIDEWRKNRPIAGK